MFKKYISLIIFIGAISIESSNLDIQNNNSSLELLVHKTPTCGCCKKWVSHMESDGFNIRTQDHQSLMKIKEMLKIEPEYRSCHTGVSSEGHFFEGHIPSKYVSQFLSENDPNAIGLSVPGMPLGSPGMEVEGRFTPYNVMIHFKDGTNAIYAEVEK